MPPCTTQRQQGEQALQRTHALLAAAGRHVQVCQLSVRLARMSVTRTGQKLDRAADDHAGASAGYQIRSVLRRGF